MLLNIILLLLLAAIAYFHYAQGLFSATVSAVCAGVAALMAFSYHETIVARFTGGTMAAYSSAVVLCGVFALIYVVLRILIDSFMPGNVRYPLVLDRIGAAVMGVVAGFFATAIVAIAAQELPFGPTVMMYTPYELETVDNDVPRELAPMYRVPSGEGIIYENEVQLARLDTEEARESRSSLWIPVDEWFIGLVGKLSGNGALAGATDFTKVHPDFKTELFGQRIGMQRSARQMALNVGGRDEVTVSAVFEATTEGQSAQFPEGLMQAQGDLGAGRAVDKWLRPRAGKKLLVLRVQFHRGAADGGLVRFSPGTARLVIAGEQYFPIATLESGTVAVAHRPDDYLLSENGADLVYEVDAASVTERGLVEPAFLEFKRFARVDLSGKPVYSVITKSPSTHLQRKIVTREYISARIADRQTGGRSSNEFHALRGTVPETEPDPASAQPGAQQGAEGEGEEPAEGGDNQSSLDKLREETNRRNQELQGGGPPD